jgi:hypothetical protein
MNLRSSLFGLALLVCASQLSYAQDQRYVEVSVTDTVMLKPTTFVYQISLTSDFSATRYVEMAKVSAMKGSVVNDTTVKFSELVKLLQANHFSFKMPEPNSLTIRANNFTDNSDSSILVTLPSLDELKRLYRLLRPLHGLTTEMSQVKYEPMPDKSAIYVSLYGKAKADAMILATVSGNTLGQLISVEEPKDLLSSFSEYISDIESNSLFRGIFSKGSGNFEKPVVKKLIFRFQIK